MRIVKIITLFLMLIPMTVFSRKRIIGLLENIYIKELNIKFTAIIDTGAVYCTLHAYGIKSFRKNNRLYVKFYTKNRKGKRRFKILPVAKILPIQSSNSQIQNRYCIYMKIKLKHIARKVLVTLTDRRRLPQLFLAGQNLLRNFFIVDVSKKFTS